MLVVHSMVKGNRFVNRPKSLNYQGIPVFIENIVGSERRWENSQNESGVVKMKYDYGYIKKTKGVDGEEIDCFVGINPYANKVYIVKLAKDDKEDKVFLGFLGREQVKRVFLDHYQSADYFGSMTEISIDQFKKLLGLN